MITIAVTNQKGGVGKSTTVANLAACLARDGYKVLGIDMDPQGNISDAFDIEIGEGQATAYEFLKKESSVDRSVVSPLSNFDLIPSDISLAVLEPELMGQMGKEQRLAEALNKARDTYDFCLIDCPPSLGLLVTMSLTASDYVLIPYKPARYSAKGVTKLFETIEMVQAYTNPNLKTLGILSTQVKSKTNNAKLWTAMATQLGESYGCYVFESYIREAVAVEDATNNGSPVVIFNKDSAVANDYEEFCDEVLRLLSIELEGGVAAHGTTHR